MLVSLLAGDVQDYNTVLHDYVEERVPREAGARFGTGEDLCHDADQMPAWIETLQRSRMRSVHKLIKSKKTKI